MRMRGVWLVAVGSLMAISAHAQAVEENIGPDLLTPARRATLPTGEREQWSAYVVASRLKHTADTASMRAELRAAGMDSTTKAPYLAPDFRYGERDATWLASDSAKMLAESVLTWQTPSGGWSKRTDMWHPRSPGMRYYSETETWHYTPTFDNGATTGQLRFLAAVNARHRDARFERSFDRGLQLILDAQQPNGCWPQTFPLEGGYHDAVTFNDDVAVLILQLLDDVVAGKFGFPSLTTRGRAGAAARRGLDCLLRAQVVQNGRRTVWGQQHDPITLAVVRARSYELPGLAGRESASIMMYLMSLQAPSTEVVGAVRAAAAWFESHETRGYRYSTYGLTKDENAPPLWARLTDLETDKPIFANRDGIKLYDWNQLTDRRSGYGWFGTEPALALAKYQEWSRTHPQSQ
jgi:PelA/Pel-15E family pectate lyase